MQYIWFLWSLILIAVWAVVYFSLRRKESRREMLLVSLWTSLFGFTEPLFVPSYWNPPSLFDLARKTGFDIESFIFSFAVGGLAAVIYESIFPIRHLPLEITEQRHLRHRYHTAALLSAPVLFVLLILFTNLNPIYATIVALLGGGLSTWYCRPDLIRKMIVSAFIFLGLYFVYFFTLIAIAPNNYVVQVWNLLRISGILVAGIPLEELLFAFSVGFLWSSVYEHLAWQKTVLFKNPVERVGSTINEYTQRT